MLCLICYKNDGVDDYVQLGITGVNVINRASKKRRSDLHVKVGDYIHKECRATYIHKWYNEIELSSDNKHIPSSTLRYFLIKIICFQT